MQMNPKKFNKKSWLDHLYYDVGRQLTNFRVCHTYKNDGEQKFSKWTRYLDAQATNKIEKADQRELLKNEVVLDLDKGDYKKFIDIFGGSGTVLFNVASLGLTDEFIYNDKNTTTYEILKYVLGGEEEINKLFDMMSNVEVSVEILTELFCGVPPTRTYLSRWGAPPTRTYLSRWEALLEHLGIKWVEEKQEAGFKKVWRIYE